MNVYFDIRDLERPDIGNNNLLGWARAIYSCMGDGGCVKSGFSAINTAIFTEEAISKIRTTIDPVQLIEEFVRIFSEKTHPVSPNLEIATRNETLSATKFYELYNYLSTPTVANDAIQQFVELDIIATEFGVDALVTFFVPGEVTSVGDRETALNIEISIIDDETIALPDVGIAIGYGTDYPGVIDICDQEVDVDPKSEQEGKTPEHGWESKSSESDSGDEPESVVGKTELESKPELEVEGTDSESEPELVIEGTDSEPESLVEPTEPVVVPEPLPPSSTDQGGRSNVPETGSATQESRPTQSQSQSQSIATKQRTDQANSADNLSIEARQNLDILIAESAHIGYNELTQSEMDTALLGNIQPMTTIEFTSMARRKLIKIPTKGGSARVPDGNSVTHRFLIRVNGITLNGKTRALTLLIISTSKKTIGCENEQVEFNIQDLINVIEFAVTRFWAGAFDAGPGEDLGVPGVYPYVIASFTWEDEGRTDKPGIEPPVGNCNSQTDWNEKWGVALKFVELFNPPEMIDVLIRERVQLKADELTRQSGSSNMIDKNTEIIVIEGSILVRVHYGGVAVQFMAAALDSILEIRETDALRSEMIELEKILHRDDAQNNRISEIQGIINGDVEHPRNYARNVFLIYIMQAEIQACGAYNNWNRPLKLVRQSLALEQDLSLLLSVYGSLTDFQILVAPTHAKNLRSKPLI